MHVTAQRACGRLTLPLPFLRRESQSASTLQASPLGLALPCPILIVHWSFSNRRFNGVFLEPCVGKQRDSEIFSVLGS